MSGGESALGLMALHADGIALASFPRRSASEPEKMGFHLAKPVFPTLSTPGRNCCFATSAAAKCMALVRKARSSPTITPGARIVLPAQRQSNSTLSATPKGSMVMIHGEIPVVSFMSGGSAMSGLDATGMFPAVGIQMNILSGSALDCLTIIPASASASLTASSPAS